MLVPEGIRIYLSLTPSDMRKSIDGLAMVVTEHLQHVPTSGDLYLFYNKRKDKLKALYWVEGCFILWYRRVSKGKFQLPPVKSGCIELSEHQLDWLLSSFDYAKMKAEMYQVGERSY